ncbi:MAG: uroporphyrinogen-III C-methyltransferase [Lachnospiraceae bacterium]|nr:uroporphyrinogen-III C-methyltransferase [Lachnospiraceae bacterium]
MRRDRGKVYLIGAGPGDTGLLSVRGAELLGQAEVLLYDRLINPMLLLEVPETCEKILVGKREGAHQCIQEKINSLLRKKSLEGKRVVRLKGGDPFVFGRGGEEILALEKEGIPYEVVPGITSSIAVPALAGIPVTHRKVARSFHVITGHTAEQGITEQLEQYASLDGTLVFLMGVGNLQEIVRQLLEHGKPADTPVSIVERGSTIYQRRIDGTLDTILELSRLEAVRPPAVFVVGKVSAYHMQSERLPLAGCRIGVTGTSHIVKKLERALKELGANVFVAPHLKIVPTDTLKNRWRKENLMWRTVHWLVFTSANGVQQFFKQIRELGMDRRMLGHLKYAVIGEGTKKALWEYGIRADYIPKDYTVKELAVGLMKELKAGEHICVLRAKNGSKELEKVWDKAGIPYEDLSIYQAKVEENIVELLWESVSVLDYLVFASAFGVQGFLEKKEFLYKRKLWEEFQGTMVSIGDQTKKVLREMLPKTKKKIVVADCHTVEGIVQKILACEKEDFDEKQT